MPIGVMPRLLGQPPPTEQPAKTDSVAETIEPAGEATALPVAPEPKKQAHENESPAPVKKKQP